MNKRIFIFNVVLILSFFCCVSVRADGLHADDFMLSDQMSFDEINHALKVYPPNFAYGSERLQIFESLDALISFSVKDNFRAAPVLVTRLEEMIQFYRNQVDRVLDAIEKTKVGDGEVQVFKLYSSSILLKSAQGVVAVDLAQGPVGNISGEPETVDAYNTGFYMTPEQRDRLAGIVDVQLITHRHFDHCDYSLAYRMRELGKTVIAPEQVKAFWQNKISGIVVPEYNTIENFGCVDILTQFGYQYGSSYVDENNLRWGIPSANPNNDSESIRYLIKIAGMVFLQSAENHVEAYDWLKSAQDNGWKIDVVFTRGQYQGDRSVLQFLNDYNNTSISVPIHEYELTHPVSSIKKMAFQLKTHNLNLFNNKRLMPVVWGEYFSLIKTGTSVPIFKFFNTNYFINQFHPNASDSHPGNDPNYPWLGLNTDKWNALEDGTIINIEAGTYTWSNSVALTKKLTIQGSSVDNIILQGMSDVDFDQRIGTTSRLATIGSTISFKRMTIRNAILPVNGTGGIFYVNKDQTLQLEDMILERTYGYGRYGGAIASRGNLNCTGVTFRNNVAMQGGAVFIQTESGDYNFIRCGFIGNSTEEGGTGSKFGGAIYLNNASGKQNRLNIVSCMFDSNESIDHTTGQGGAIHLRLNADGGIVETKIINSSFVNNKTYGTGSAIATSISGTANESACFVLDIRNTTFIENRNHELGNKNGTTINIFDNTDYNMLSQRGIFNLVNNTFFNNVRSDADINTKSIYMSDSKFDVRIINNVLLDSDANKKAISLQLPITENPNYIYTELRGNVGDVISVCQSSWSEIGYGNLQEKYNDEVFLSTTTRYNVNGVAYLPIISSNSILINTGFSMWNMNDENIVPQQDILDQPVLGQAKDIGVYEFNQLTTRPDLSKADLSFFPNPFSEYIQIDQEMLVISIFDLAGSLCIRVENGNKINTSVLEKGIYSVCGITSDNKLLYKKMIKM